MVSGSHHSPVSHVPFGYGWVRQDILGSFSCSVGQDMCLHSQLLRTGSSGHGLEQKQLFGFLPALLSSLGRAFAALCCGIWVTPSSANASASQKRSCCTGGVRVWGLHRDDAPHLGMLLGTSRVRWSWHWAEPRWQLSCAPRKAPAMGQRQQGHGAVSPRPSADGWPCRAPQS